MSAVTKELEQTWKYSMLYHESGFFRFIQVNERTLPNFPLRI